MVADHIGEGGIAGEMAQPVAIGLMLGGEDDRLALRDMLKTAILDPDAAEAQPAPEELGERADGEGRRSRAGPQKKR